MPDERTGQDRSDEQIHVRDLRGAEYVEKADGVRPAPPTPEPNPPEGPSGGVDPDGPVNQVRSTYIEKAQDSAQDRKADAPRDKRADSN